MPGGRQFSGVCMECASVRFASRCSDGPSTRPQHCAAFAKRCAMMAVESTIRRRSGLRIAR
eukprot:11025414-Lingulodinium_polyedra.AAC.1